MNREITHADIQKTHQGQMALRDAVRRYILETPLARTMVGAADDRCIVTITVDDACNFISKMDLDSFVRSIPDLIERRNAISGIKKMHGDGFDRAVCWIEGNAATTFLYKRSDFAFD